MTVEGKRVFSNCSCMIDGKVTDQSKFLTGTSKMVQKFSVGALIFKDVASTSASQVLSRTNCTDLYCLIENVLNTKTLFFSATLHALWHLPGETYSNSEFKGLQLWSNQQKVSCVLLKNWMARGGGNLLWTSCRIKWHVCAWQRVKYFRLRFFLFCFVYHKTCQIAFQDLITPLWFRWKELYGDDSVCTCCESTCSSAQPKGKFPFLDI